MGRGLKLNPSLANDLALGANSAAQAVRLYREAGKLPDTERAARKAKIVDAVGQAKLAARFLFDFLKRQGEDIKDVAHEIEQSLSGSDDDDG